MTTQKNKRWILYLVFLMLFSLVVYRTIYPDDYSINENFFRDNPDFYFQRDAKGLFICRSEYYSNEELKQLLDAPDRPFELKKRWIKDADATSILTWRIGGKKYVIKRYNAQDIFHFIKQLIPYSTSKALRSFYYSYLFDKMDINSAKAIAVIERRIGPFHGTTYQIMEHIKGMKGHDFFDNSKIPEIDYKKSIKETVDIAKKLEHANLIHGKLSLGHLFYVEGSPYLIGLDQVRHYKSKSIFFKRQRQRKDLNVLVEDVGEKLQKKEREYFTNYYREQVDPSIKTALPNF